MPWNAELAIAARPPLRQLTTMGTLSSVSTGFLNPNLWKNSVSSNWSALFNSGTRIMRNWLRQSKIIYLSVVLVFQLLGLFEYFWHFEYITFYSNFKTRELIGLGWILTGFLKLLTEPVALENIVIVLHYILIKITVW